MLLPVTGELHGCGERWPEIAPTASAGRHEFCSPNLTSTRQLDHDTVETTFWLALDWGTYRSLTRERDMSPDTFERWLREYYRRMLGA